MTGSDRDRTRIVRAWLEEGSTELSSRVLDGVLREFPLTPQERPSGSGRVRINAAIRFAAATAAAVILVVVGAQFWASSESPGPGAGSTAIPTPPREATPTPDAGYAFDCATGPGTTWDLPDPPLGVGLVGFAAEDAEPSLPSRGEMVDTYWVRGGGLPYRGMARLFADGRLIWNYANMPALGDTGVTGYIEQRLTPSGVELVRREYRLSRKDPMVLNACLAPSAWADPTYRQYVPAAYAACLEASNLEQTHGLDVGLDAMLAMLPAPVRGLLEGKDLVPHGTGDPGGGQPAFVGDSLPCLRLSPGEARALDAALQVAGFEQESWVAGPGTRYFVAVEQGLIHIMFEPVFPDGTVGCSYCG